MRPLVPLLHRYLFAELLKVFVLVLTVLTVLVVFVGVFQEATERGMGPLQLMRVLPYIVPSMLPFTIPATLLLTVSVVYGRVAGDHEITAAKAAGINVLSLMGPSFCLGGVLSVGALLLTDQVIPWALDNIQRTAIAAAEEIFLDRLRTEHQLHYKPARIRITVNDVMGRKLINPVFQYHDAEGEIVTLQADEALVEFNLEREVAVLHLRNAMMDTPGEAASGLYVQGDEAIEIPLPLHDGEEKPRHLQVSEINQELRTIAAERAEFEQQRAIEATMALTLGDFDRLSSPTFATAREIQQGEERRHRLRTEYHSRIALSCSCLFFVLVGSPFAILKAKSQFFTSFLYCFGPIVGVYYPLVIGLMAQCKHGHLEPAWAMWLGNLLVLVAAGVLIRRVMQH
jgi:lipopolysaccharide export system permease protein